MTVSDAIVALGARLFSRSRMLLSFWARRANTLSFADGPWTPLRKDPRECRVVLVTTAGVHRTADRPFDMTDRRGDPSYREIPSGTPSCDLRITHDYYDHRDADADVNVVFPIDRIREMASSGEIGGISPTFFSFMGHVAGPHLPVLIEKTSREVAARVAGEAADLAVLTPA